MVPSTVPGTVLFLLYRYSTAVIMAVIEGVIDNHLTADLLLQLASGSTVL